MIYRVEDLFLRIRNGMNIKQEMDAGGLPITRIETIANAEINLERVGYAGLSMEQARNYLLEDSEILFSHINSVSHIGKCALYTKDMGELVHGMNLLSFKPNQTLLFPKYALYAFRSQQFKDQLAKSIKKAVNQASVSIGDIKNITLNVPPLVEQQRIASILDKAAEIKAKREQAIAKLDELAQSTFVETFGHEKWSKVAIAEVTEQVQSCSPQNRFVGEFTYVDIGAVDNVSKTVINPQLIDKNDAPSRARQLIKKDDVLVSTVRPNLNAVAKVESEYLNAVASTGFCVLRCKQDMVLPEYIFAIVKSTKFVNEMVRLATGASYPAVSDKIISQYLIPLPPIALQRAFAEKIKALREYASKSVRHEGKLIGLTASLQHQAFTTGFNA